MADSPSRKLTVILHADVVGSTALVQEDEALAHERMKNAFCRLGERIEALAPFDRERGLAEHPTEIRREGRLAAARAAGDSDQKRLVVVVQIPSLLTDETADCKGPPPDFRYRRSGKPTAFDRLE